MAIFVGRFERGEEGLIGAAAKSKVW